MIRVYEDNAGGLYLVPNGEGIAIGGLDPDTCATTDCRLYRDTWAPEDGPHHVYPASIVDDATHIATWDGDRMRVEYRRDGSPYAGLAGSRYLGLGDGYDDGDEGAS
jgi:hypothetical protein